MTYKEIEDKLKQGESYKMFTELGLKEQSAFIWMAAKFIDEKHWEEALGDFSKLLMKEVS